MARFIQEGKVINYYNDTSNAIAYGDVIVLSQRIGVAASNIPAGSTGAVELEGVFEFTAETTAGFAVGQSLYWDAAEKKLTATKAETGAIYAGIAVDPKALASDVAYVKI